MTNNDKRFRYQLIGEYKFQVVKVDHGLSGMRIHVRLGSTMQLDSPVDADVQVGELLTFRFFTEVLRKDRPIQ